MEKEPIELEEARIQLKRFEESLGDPAGLPCLQRGISLLVDIIEGDSPQIYKDRAKNLVVAYRGKVSSEVKDILSKVDSYALDFLQHWNGVMDVFTDTGVDDDREFKASKDQLFTEWGKRFVKSLSPWELEMLKKEFQKKTTTESS